MAIRKEIFTTFFLVIALLLFYGCNKNNFEFAQADLENSTSIENFGGVVGNERGNLAPDFEVQLIDGTNFKLSDYKGNKPVIIEFWATWCPYCKKDFRVVKNIYPNYKNEVEFLAIDLDSSEDVATIEEYIDENGLHDIKFATADTDVLSDYSVISTTTKYAISRDGTILWKGSGDVDAETWEVIFKGLKDS